MWLGAGLIGLLLVALYPVGYYEYTRLSFPSNSDGSPTITFQGTPIDTSMLPFGEDHVCCFAGAFGLVLAGLVYKARKKENTTILDQADRSIPHAGRQN